MFLFTAQIHRLPSTPMERSGRGCALQEKACEGPGPQGAVVSSAQGLFTLPACFSPDGAQLLTTDQKSEIRVYSASRWDCPLNLIPHPHRHFQHLTPIKVSDGRKSVIVGQSVGRGQTQKPLIPDLFLP